MQEALVQGRKALGKGEIPVGAVVLTSDLQVSEIDGTGHLCQSGVAGHCSKPQQL